MTNLMAFESQSELEGLRLCEHDEKVDDQKREQQDSSLIIGYGDGESTKDSLVV